MSSILKALKKIEGRKVDTSLPVWPYGAGNLESMDRYIRRSRRRQKILGVLILLCVVALAGKLYIGSRPPAERGASATVAPGSASPSPAPLPEESVRVPAPETRIAIRAASESRPEAPAPSPEKAPPPVDTTAPETAASTVVSPPAPEPTGTAAAETTPASPFTDAFAAPPADNDGLSLLALVWSEQPESRFVVLNGTIVRQGGSIENSTVVRIEEDYVVMRTGGITWKLK